MLKNNRVSLKIEDFTRTQYSYQLIELLGVFVEVSVTLLSFSFVSLSAENNRVSLKTEDFACSKVSYNRGAATWNRPVDSVMRDSSLGGEMILQSLTCTPVVLCLTLPPSSPHKSELVGFFVLFVYLLVCFDIKCILCAYAWVCVCVFADPWRRQGDPTADPVLA